ncbi:hypothetical protein GE061_000673 [Apolygus lucorum]|uniref:mRNA-decapping enzyme C-terminal domain-containing protein n=1 Tax=Apolygus lucorum TaxID=248454 RepID=A0A6A4J249_APOLU|nr:hypothetical protein GE061_000673 [Apolygus lucorum]
MAKSESMSMNVSSLKLKDPYFKEILDMAGHVVLYNYNPDIQNWEKTEVEGALFVYSRTTEPQYYAFIMNRLNTTNHIEHIDENVELQRHEPFILLKNSKGTIHGIWFYDRDECVRMANLMEGLSSEVAQSKNVHLKSNNSATKSGAETNKRVMDFFARAGGKAPMGRPPPPMATINMSEVNPLVQRLLSSTSNPVQTVEEIEKRQKVGPTQHEERPVMTSHLSTQPSGPIAIQRQVSEPPPSKSLENGLSYLRISNDSPTPISSSIPTQHFFNSSLRQASSPNPTTDLPLEVSVLERAVIDPPPISKPALLPPVMFTSNLRQEEPPMNLFQASTPHDATLGLQPPNSYQPPGAGGEPALSPLTKPQLLQAVNYLLKNDADFLNKLHEAYVKSFVDMVS